MKITPGGNAGQLIGRNGSPVASFYSAEVASHASTVRITTTVPAGKVYHLTYITDLIAPITVGTGNLNRASTWTLQKVGGAAIPIVRYTSPAGASIGMWEHYQIRDTWMDPGDILELSTFDLSTAGTTFFTCQAQIQAYDI